LRDAAEGRRTLAGFAATAVHALLGLCRSCRQEHRRAQFEGQSAPALPPGTLDNVRKATEVAIILSSVLTPVVVWVAVSLAMQLVTRFFNGSEPLPAEPAVVFISGVPPALSAAVGLVLTGLQAALGAQIAAGVALGYAGGLLGLAVTV
jgi:hypothetical protein